MQLGLGRLTVRRHADVGLAVALAALGQCELFLRSLRADFHGPRALNAALVVMIALPVVWRRQAPLAALVAYVIPASVWLDLVYGPSANLPLEPFLVLLILIYSAASYAPASQTAAVLAVVGAVFVSEVVLLASGAKSVGNTVPGLVFITLSYLVGRALRGKHALAESMQRRAAAVEADSDRQARLAVAAERDRIARELHDVIAHSVSLIVVQAGAGERLLDTEPERARSSFETIRRAGGDALDELRRLLGLLRDQPLGLAPIEPQPGLGRLELLLADSRAAGLEVDLELRGDRRELPPGVDLAAYRIVQEGLTNIRKHAAGAHAEVAIEFQPRALELTIDDDGAGSEAASVSDGSGNGLIGMRERAALYGGMLDAGPRPGGGFRVHARLPTDRSAP